MPLSQSPAEKVEVRPASATCLLTPRTTAMQSTQASEAIGSESLHPSQPDAEAGESDTAGADTRTATSSSGSSASSSVTAAWPRGTRRKPSTSQALRLARRPDKPRLLDVRPYLGTEMNLEQSSRNSSADEKLRPQPSRRYTTLNDFVQSFAGGRSAKVATAPRRIPATRGCSPPCWSARPCGAAGLQWRNDGGADGCGNVRGQAGGPVREVAPPVPPWRSIPTAPSTTTGKSCTITRTVTIKSTP